MLPYQVRSLKCLLKKHELVKHAFTREQSVILIISKQKDLELLYRLKEQHIIHLKSIYIIIMPKQ